MRDCNGSVLRTERLLTVYVDMIVEILRGEKDRDEILVYFKNENTDDFYYAHSIPANRSVGLGTPDDEPGASIQTMWSWINHMSMKRWWNANLQRDFIAEVERLMV